MKKFLMFVGIVLLCEHSANAAHLICPEGCFCLNDGYNSQTGYSSESSTNVSGNLLYNDYCKQPITPPQGPFNKQYGNVRIASDCNNNENITYCLEEFSEFYEGYMGFYGFVNNSFIYGYTKPYIDLLQCPYTHPNSDKGAKTIFGCYRITANGQKEYYTHTNTQNNYSGNYDNSNINALMQNLQSALNQANTAAQNLQNALNSSNLANTTQSQTATTLNNTNTITKMTNAQTFVSPTSAPTTTTQSQTTQSTTATPTTAPVTMKLSDVKTDSTTSSPLKKLDFGNLSSIFSADKAAVHNTAIGRAALPANPSRVSHIKKSSPIRATTNGATSTPPQTNTAPAPTRANTKTKRIASER
ncbi:MAG: hypothetical protein ACLRFM_01040 [Alphaproteobacteria bacterium]